MRRAGVLLGAVLLAGNSLATDLPEQRPPSPRDAAGPALRVPLPPVRPPAAAISPNRVTTPAAEHLICEDPRLIGTRAANVVGHLPGCGILNPVKIREIAGVKLSTPATLDCRTARTFANWVSGVAQPEARRVLGARISKLWIMGSYVCRTRNHRVGARVSEHGAGRAVDVGGVWLGNGQRITVLGNWGKGDAGQFLRNVWKKACGPFRTVLGPGADRFHQDHLHLDTAYRNRSYCR